MNKQAQIIVRTYNCLASEINNIYPYVVRLLHRIDGNKIVRMDGTLTSKSRQAITAAGIGLQGVKTKDGHGYYSTAMQVRANGERLYLQGRTVHNGGTHGDRSFFHHYEEEHVPLGNIDPETGRMIRVFDPEYLKLIDIAREMDKIREYKMLYNRATEVFSSIHRSLATSQTVMK